VYLCYYYYYYYYYYYSQGNRGFGGRMRRLGSGRLWPYLPMVVTWSVLPLNMALVVGYLPLMIQVKALVMVK